MKNNNTIIDIMMKDEYLRTLQSIKDYEKEINKLPQGSLFIRKDNYAYLSKRNGEYIEKTYIGKVGSLQYQQILLQYNKRKSYEESLNKLYVEKEKLEKFLKIKENIEYGQAERDNFLEFD